MYVMLCIVKGQNIIITSSTISCKRICTCFTWNALWLTMECIVANNTMYSSYVILLVELNK